MNAGVSGNCLRIVCELFSYIVQNVRKENGWQYSFSQHRCIIQIGTPGCTSGTTEKVRIRLNETDDYYAPFIFILLLFIFFVYSHINCAFVWPGTNQMVGYALQSLQVGDPGQERNVQQQKGKIIFLYTFNAFNDRVRHIFGPARDSETRGLFGRGQIFSHHAHSVEIKRNKKRTELFTLWK